MKLFKWIKNKLFPTKPKISIEGIGPRQIEILKEIYKNAGCPNCNGARYISRFPSLNTKLPCFNCNQEEYNKIYEACFGSNPSKS
jgi:hypothetical protein